MDYINDGDWTGIPIDTTENRMVMWNGLDIKITHTKNGAGENSLFVDIWNLSKEQPATVRFQWYGMPDEDEEFVVHDLPAFSSITKEVPARGRINILKHK